MLKVIRYIFSYTFIRNTLWFCILFFLFILAVLFITGPKESVTGPIGWERKFFLTPYAIKAQNVNLAYSGKLVAVVYEGAEKGKKGIYCSLSFDSGLSFIDPIKIASIKSQIDNNPTVAVSSTGKIVVMWQNLDESGTRNKMFQIVSKDMGVGWSKPKIVSFGYETEILPKVFYDKKDKLHLFFHAHKGGNFNLFHALDDGRGGYDDITPLIKLTKTMRGAFFPAIHLARDDVYLVWQGKGSNFSDDLFFIRSTNSGRSWSSPQRITTSVANDAAPSLLYLDGILYCAYQNNDQKNWSIKLIRGYRGGDRWDPEPIVVSNTGADCYAPRLIASEDSLIVTWHDLRQKQPQVVVRKFLYRERTLSKELTLSQASRGARFPFIYSTKNRAGIIWTEGNRIASKLSDVYVAPPRVFSKTHPANIWSRVPTARISWKPPRDESGILGYATIVNKIQDFNPAIQNIKATINSTTIPNLDDGITYFHIRAVDGAGNLSRTIHYPVKTSINPLPMPVVVSTTHPQSRSVDSNTPVLRWSGDEIDRLKGFVYSLSKDSVKRPGTFIDRLEIQFKNLPKGRYYFSIAAVDKTNSLSEINTYDFIIGKDISPDKSYLNKIAKGVKELERKEARRKGISVKTPFFALDLPFNPLSPFEGDSFKGLIRPKNISQSDVIGYSVVISSVRSKVPKRINTKGSILSVSGLKDGTQVIGLRMKYKRKVGTKVIESWTRPLYTDIQVVVPRFFSPMALYANDIDTRIREKKTGALVAAVTAACMLLLMALGRKFSFYLKFYIFKLRRLG